MQLSGIHFTIDLKKQTNKQTKKSIIQVIHFIRNRNPSHYYTINHLEALAETCCIDQKPKKQKHVV